MRVSINLLFSNFAVIYISEESVVVVVVVVVVIVVVVVVSDNLHGRIYFLFIE